MTLPSGLVFFARRGEAIPAIRVVDYTIFNNGNKTLSTQLYSARLTRQGVNKKTLKDMQGLFGGAQRVASFLHQKHYYSRTSTYSF